MEAFRRIYRIPLSISGCQNLWLPPTKEMLTIPTKRQSSPVKVSCYKDYASTSSSIRAEQWWRREHGFAMTEFSFPLLFAHLYSIFSFYVLPLLSISVFLSFGIASHYFSCYFLVSFHMFSCFASWRDCFHYMPTCLSFGMASYPCVSWFSIYIVYVLLLFSSSLGPLIEHNVV